MGAAFLGAWARRGDFHFLPQPSKSFHFLPRRASENFHSLPKVAKNFRETGLIKGLWAARVEKNPPFRPPAKAAH
jgi:hypothetical protein